MAIAPSLYPTKTVRRSWRDRFFTFPWRPWVATKQVRDWKAPFTPHTRPLMRQGDRGHTDSEG